MIERFENDGWPSSYLSAYNYDSSQSNRTNAEKEVKPHVEELLKATRAEKVDIIAHSMGSLSTRWYIKELGGEAKVDDWVSLAGPNHGTVLADYCAEIPCEEMRPGSTFLSELNAGDGRTKSSLADEVGDVVVEELRQAPEISPVIARHDPNECDRVILVAEAVEQTCVSVDDPLQQLARVVDLACFGTHVRHERNYLMAPRKSGDFGANPAPARKAPESGFSSSQRLEQMALTSALECTAIPAWLRTVSEAALLVALPAGRALAAAPGDLDPTFGGGRVIVPFGSEAGAGGVAVQPDGKVVVAGSSEARHAFAVARLLPNGSPDPSFGEAGVVTTPLGEFASSTDVAVQSDGKIVAVGEANEDFAIVRYLKIGNSTRTSAKAAS